MKHKDLYNAACQFAYGNISSKDLRDAVEKWYESQHDGKPDVSGSLPLAQERDEDDPYCLNCGNEKLTYVEQYANGECWECKPCDWRTYIKRQIYH